MLQVLSRVATGDPVATWALLQTPAAKSHPRWVELAVRVTESAAARGVAVDLDGWYRAAAERTSAASGAERPAFRKMSIEVQMQLADDVDIGEDEVAEVRAAIVAAGGDGTDGSPEMVAALAAKRDASRAT